jgi:archaellum component FlaD/FlaE/archaellum component FlaC
MGMMDWVNDEDEDDEASGDVDEDEDDTDEFDDLGEFDDEFDDLDDDFDGPTAADADEGDDGFDDLDGDFGDLDDDGFGGGGGSAGGDDVTERLADFEDRIGELETEVGSISSSMNTVREENKQIGETVDELDDTIRKLLDIYEMVTRGINPFVDDAREMGGLEHGDGAFGLFDSEEEDDEDLDPDVANADAESFFDEDFGELDAETGEERAEAAAEDELAEAEPDEPEMLDEGPDPADAEAADAGGGGGVSFDDLKAEYEDGDGWDDDADDADEDAANDAGDADDSDEADDAVDGYEDDAEATDEETDLGDGAGEVADGTATPESGAGRSERLTLPSDSEPADADVLDEPTADVDDPDDDRESVGVAEPSVEAAEAVTDDEMFHDAEAAPADSETDSERGDEIGREKRGATRADESTAHLSTLPSTYVAESVAMEWVRFLVSAGGPLGASRALRLYQDFGWISADVRSKLDTYVRLAASPRDDEQHAQLAVDHHETSLSYVSRLGGHEPDPAALEALVADGGSDRGLRR